MSVTHLLILSTCYKNTDVGIEKIFGIEDPTDEAVIEKVFHAISSELEHFDLTYESGDGYEFTIDELRLALSGGLYFLGNEKTTYLYPISIQLQLVHVNDLVYIMKD